MKETSHFGTRTRLNTKLKQKHTKVKKKKNSDLKTVVTMILFDSECLVSIKNVRQRIQHQKWPYSSGQGEIQDKLDLPIKELTEELRKFGLPTEGTVRTMQSTLSSFLKDG